MGKFYLSKSMSWFPWVLLTVIGLILLNVLEEEDMPNTLPTMPVCLSYPTLYSFMFFQDKKTASILIPIAIFFEYLFSSILKSVFYKDQVGAEHCVNSIIIVFAIGLVFMILIPILQHHKENGFLETEKR